MPEKLQAVTGERVALADGIGPATVWIERGRIAAIETGRLTNPGTAILDAGTSLVFPGLVDSHVHINDPGRADWEGFATATRGAAAGGITTVIDMPLNSTPATTTVEALDRKRQAAENNCWVDVGFWGGVVPGNAGEISGLAEAGVCGFKAFLVDSGVPEFEAIGFEELREVAPAIAATGLPLLVHAEHPGEIVDPIDLSPGQRREYASYLASRPPRAEVVAIEGLIGIAAESRLRLHIVHLATGQALATIRAARHAGVSVTVETCPHYLTFAAEDIEDGQTQFKCAPPIRDAKEREALWQALLSGDIDFVATDHSPSPPAMKQLESGDFFTSWGGIASLQLLLPAVWTVARRRGVTVDRLAEWLSAGPARLAGLSDRKGGIATGHDADFVIWDPDQTWIVDGERLEHRHSVTPFAGRELLGVVRSTVLRGEVVFSEDSVRAPARGAPTTPASPLPEST